MKKFFTTLLIMILLLIPAVGEAASIDDYIKRSRVTSEMKDASGSIYNIYMYSTNEKKDIVTEDEVWAGAWVGDIQYKGTYNFALKKKGTPKAVNAGINIKGYTYNQTRKMVYKVPSKSKGQPDLLVVAQTESSNFESGMVLFVDKGKLKVVTVKDKNRVYRELGYGLRPRVKSKNLFETLGYSNVDSTWTLTQYSMDAKAGQLKVVKRKTYNFEEGKKLANKW